MKGFGKSVSGLLLIALIAFGMVTPTLQAGPAARARFQLPFDAKWGFNTLRTGTYTISVEHFASSGMITVYHDNQAVGMVYPQTFESFENKSVNAELVCIRHDGVVTVRALRLPGAGTFYFSLPKELKTLVTQQPQLIETVPVEVGGN